MFEKKDKIAVKFIVLALHIGVAHRYAEDVFVEGSREVALEQLVVIDGLGNEAPNELEIAQMIRVDV